MEPRQVPAGLDGNWVCEIVWAVSPGGEHFDEQVEGVARHAAAGVHPHQGGP